MGGFLLRGARSLCGGLAAALWLLCTVGVQAQRNEPAPQQNQSGMATGSPQGAQFDEEHRPITAGGFVKMVA